MALQKGKRHKRHINKHLFGMCVNLDNLQA